MPNNQILGAVGALLLVRSILPVVDINQRRRTVPMLAKDKDNVQNFAVQQPRKILTLNLDKNKSKALSANKSKTQSADQEKRAPLC